MANILNLKSSQARKHNKAVLIEYMTILKHTKDYYNNLRPYFKIRFVYNMARAILDFRDELGKHIEILNDRIKEENE